MNIKSLLLGSAAALAAATGAHAADAIVAAEPEPLEYVRICDAYGAGYFFIPGTETCLKLGGRVRTEGLWKDAYNPASHNGTLWHTRAEINVDTATDTEYGALKTKPSSVRTGRKVATPRRSFSGPISASAASWSASRTRSTASTWAMPATSSTTT